MNTPSVIERGAQEDARRQAEEQARKERWTQECHDHTISRFYMDFYRHHYKANPDYRSYSYREPRYIHDPPLPEVTEWDASAFGDTRADSTFVCEGLRYICRWRFEGTGGDPAYWDDGWWPDWFLVLDKPFKLLPFLTRKVEVQVYGPENVAQALA